MSIVAYSFFYGVHQQAVLVEQLVVADQSDYLPDCSDNL